MKKMTIVFPGSFMNYREIDPDMHEEYLAVMETGLFDVLFFNFDEWIAGDKFRIIGTENTPSNAIYRGWMLKPEKYDELYKTLHDRGVLLITDPDAYRNMHLFPNVYPHIKEDTAEMMLFADGKVDVEKAKKRFRRFMVKDSVKSVKGTEFPSYFDHTLSQSGVHSYDTETSGTSGRIEGIGITTMIRQSSSRQSHHLPMPLPDMQWILVLQIADKLFWWRLMMDLLLDVMERILYSMRNCCLPDGASLSESMMNAMCIWNLSIGRKRKEANSECFRDRLLRSREYEK